MAKKDKSSHLRPPQCKEAVSSLDITRWPRGPLELGSTSNANRLDSDTSHAYFRPKACEAFPRASLWGHFILVLRCHENKTGPKHGEEMTDWHTSEDKGKVHVKLRAKPGEMSWEKHQRKL